MDVVERQVPPDVADLAVVGQQLADDRLGLTAVRALEVAVFDDGDQRLARAADVVELRVDGGGQVDDRLGRAEQRPAARASGGSMPVTRKTAQAASEATSAAVRTPSLASCELVAGEGERARSASRR